MEIILILVALAWSVDKLARAANSVGAGGHYHRDGYGNAIYVNFPYSLCDECKKRKEQKLEDYNKYDAYGPDFG